MAALFAGTALLGFGPTSLDLLAMVEAGARPPLILHVHAACMATWLLLLLTQTSLVAAGRTALHRKLGLAALVVAPAVVAAMIGVTLESWRSIASLGPSLNDLIVDQDASKEKNSRDFTLRQCSATALQARDAAHLRARQEIP